MVGLLIIAHVPLASSLKAVAEHTYKESAPLIEALDVESWMSPEDVEARARELLARVRRPEALILTDVFGATPCKGALRLADGVQVKVLTGVNVPMLWRTLCYSKEPLETLVELALTGAAQGVMQVASARPQNQASTAAANDPQQHHDQQ